ncbi:hypothetical protein [Faecalimonas sp.]
MKEEYTLKLDAGQCGYFETVWANLYEQTKQREDLNTVVKEMILKMYASLLIQLYSQSLEFLKEKKKNNDFDEFFTEKNIDDLINSYEKEIKKYDTEKNEVKNDK